jgi:hypothetical protein
MHKHLLRGSVRWALAAIVIGLMSASATAGSFTRGCALRDLQVLMLIEERESANAISPEDLGNAVLAMLRAQMDCHEGRVGDAFALYDDISRSITAAPDTFGRRRRDVR